MNQESSLNQKVNNNTPLKQNPRTPSRLQRGAATPSNLTYDFEGVFDLEGELSPSDHLSSGLTYVVKGTLGRVQTPSLARFNSLAWALI